MTIRQDPATSDQGALWLHVPPPSPDTVPSPPSPHPVPPSPEVPPEIIDPVLPGEQQPIIDPIPGPTATMLH